MILMKYLRKYQIKLTVNFISFFFSLRTYVQMFFFVLEKRSAELRLKLGSLFNILHIIFLLIQNKCKSSLEL